jgi:hypothetical protein
MNSTRAVYGTFEAAIRSFADKPLRKVKMPKRKVAKAKSCLRGISHVI